MNRITNISPVNVSTSAIQIVPFDATRMSLLIRNASGGICFIGTSAKTPDVNGFPLNEGDSLSFKVVDGDASEVAFYAIAPSGDANLRIVMSYQN